MQTRVVIIDDHRLFAAGLKNVLSDTCDVLGIAVDRVTAIGMARTLKPDVIILDISMENVSGIEILETLKTDVPPYHFIILTMHSEIELAKAAFRHGASAYIGKASSSAVLKQALVAAMRGEKFLSPELGWTLDSVCDC